MSIPTGGMDAPTEDESPRDGLLSYAGEWHSAVIGVATGLVSGLTGVFAFASFLVGAALTESYLAGNPRALREVRREPWYALGGLVAGLLVGFALRPVFPMVVLAGP